MKASTRHKPGVQGTHERQWVTLWLGSDAPLGEGLPTLQAGLERIAAYLAQNPGERVTEAGKGRRRCPGRIDAIRAAVRELLLRLDREQS